MLYAIRNCPKCHDLGFCHCFISRRTISHRAGNLHDFGDPAAVRFTFAFN